MIEISNLTKTFKNNKVFDNVSFKISDGQVVRIMGDNGSGKSVLMKLMVGYSSIDSGEIKIDGKILKKDIEFIKNAGVFINAPEFIPSETGLENLLYLASFRKEVTKEKIIELAELLYFEMDITKKYKTYSLGMKQKMRFIQAIMEDNKYLIIDEPFDGLDKKSKLAVVRLLNEYMNKNRLIIYTSHSDDFLQYTTSFVHIESPSIVYQNVLNDEQTSDYSLSKQL